MDFSILSILNYDLAGNLVMNYLISLVLFIVALILLRIFKFVIVKKLKTISKKTKTKIDDLLIDFIESINWFFYILIALYISLKYIQIPNFIDTGLYYLVLIFITYYTVRLVSYLIDYTTNIYMSKKENTKAGREKKIKEEHSSIIELFVKFLKAIVWFIAIILILSNLGYDVSSLLAGLGIGGIAIALALQNILSDVFASLSIYFDKPFQIGDFIVVGDNMGTVKKIGIKTTRLESLWGEEIVMSNRDLTSAVVKNYKRMRRRRAQFSFGVTYETPTRKLKKVLKIIEDIFKKIDIAELDRVHFKEFGDFSLNFEVVYYINTKDYKKYMDIQQDIGFRLKDAFEKHGIEFAYPTQTIFLNKQK